MERNVVFVCLHGAGKSRVAAALFNAAPPPGWRATSAGLRPQEAPSEHAHTMLTGHHASAFLDNDAPRPLARNEEDLVVGIDCEIEGARDWRLAHEWPDPQVRQDLQALVERLAAELA